VGLPLAATASLAAQATIFTLLAMYKSRWRSN